MTKASARIAGNRVALGSLRPVELIYGKYDQCKKSS